MVEILNYVYEDTTQTNKLITEMTKNLKNFLFNSFENDILSNVETNTKLVQNMDELTKMQLTKTSFIFNFKYCNTNKSFGTKCSNRSKQGR